MRLVGTVKLLKAYKGSRSFYALVLCITGLLFLTVNYSGDRYSRNCRPTCYRGLEVDLAEPVKSITIYENKGSEEVSILTGTPVLSTNWEELVKNDPPLLDWRSSSNPDLSMMFIINRKLFYKIGDELIVKIVVQDFYGMPKKRGGDVVRVVAKDEEKRARSIGYVVDHGDGTYTGVVKLLWSGDVTIEAHVGSSREMIQILYRLVTSGAIKRPFTGVDSKQNIVNCTPSYDVAKHFTSLCNLTHANADLPWYCERHPSGDCDIDVFPFMVKPISVTDEEMLMLDRVNKHLLPDALYVHVHKGAKGADHIFQTHVMPPCNSIPSRSTWNLTSPVGSLYGDTWYPRHCRNTFKGTVQHFQKCLRGRTTYFIGDSNMREMFKMFMEFADTTLSTEAWKERKWHKYSGATSADGTVLMAYGFHALPRYASLRGKINGTHTYIDNIPAGSTDVVIVHFYMHYHPFHPSVVRQAIRKTVQSIQSLKTRAPDSKIFVRGCHAVLVETERTNFDDTWAIVYNKILKEEFVDITDKVYFLDMWDISVAMENTDIHPPRTVLSQAVYNLMSFLCP